MSITNFIPTVWSENLLTALDGLYVAVAHCNRDYEGEIKNQGSIVKICGINNIDVRNYTKDSDMYTPQALSDTVMDLIIDQAKYFNFQIDDIDKTQCSPKLMEAAVKAAASALANEADRYIYAITYRAAHNINKRYEKIGDLFDAIIEARQKLYESNVSDMESVVLEVSPTIASMILKEKMSLPFCEASVVETGYLGSIAGCKVYVSNNVSLNSGDTQKCVMRTTRAIAFAEQFSEIEAYRPERRFADAIKGLHLYGAEVIYPEEIVNLSITF